LFPIPHRSGTKNPGRTSPIKNSQEVKKKEANAVEPDAHENESGSEGQHESDETESVHGQVNHQFKAVQEELARFKQELARINMTSSMIKLKQAVRKLSILHIITIMLLLYVIVQGRQPIIAPELNSIISNDSDSDVPQSGGAKNDTVNMINPIPPLPPKLIVNLLKPPFPYNDGGGAKALQNFHYPGGEKGFWGDQTPVDICITTTEENNCKPEGARVLLMHSSERVEGILDFAKGLNLPSEKGRVGDKKPKTHPQFFLLTR